MRPDAPQPYLIGIAGPSGAGKTTLARMIAARLDAPILSLDCYYRELDALPLEERAGMNFDEPAALDHELLLAHAGSLVRGADITVPEYDFARHTRAPRTHVLPARPFVVMEGLFALYWAGIRALLGARVFVAAQDGLCFERRLERDVKERGRTPASVAGQYERTVRPMAERYVLPTSAFADVLCSGTEPLEESCARVLAHVERTRGARAAAL